MVKEVEKIALDDHNVAHVVVSRADEPLAEPLHPIDKHRRDLMRMRERQHPHVTDDFVRLQGDGLHPLNPEMTARWAAEIMDLRRKYAVEATHAELYLGALGSLRREHLAALGRASDLESKLRAAEAEIARLTREAKHG